MFDEDSSDEKAQDDIVSEKKTMSAIAPSLVSSSLSTMRLAMKISQDPELLINLRDEKRRLQQDRNADEMNGLEETMSSISI